MSCLMDWEFLMVIFLICSSAIIFQRFRWSRSATVCGNHFVYVCVSLCSHVEKITTWQDPRKTMAAGMNQMSLHAQAASNNGGVQGRSMALSQPNLGEDLHTHSSCSLSGILLSLQRFIRLNITSKVSHIGATNEQNLLNYWFEPVEMKMKMTFISLIMLDRLVIILTGKLEVTQQLFLILEDLLVVLEY